MTGYRFRECLARLGWLSGTLAKMMNLMPGQTRAWSGSREPVPDEVAEWLERLVAFHERNPPPSIRQTSTRRPSAQRSLATLS
jgi:hypothetical protein